MGLGLSVVPFNDGFFPVALQVCAGSMPKKVRDQFLQYCATQPTVSYLIEAIGSWNFQVGARLDDSRKVTALSDDIQRRFAPYVSRVTAIPVHEYLKLFPHPLVAPCARKALRVA